mmetsp:Transcript_52831/g.148212  ORF Transcript_52831/g.148212 Transcript_52831/m.148212 type:complete len:292 (+) Transcript_52831:90-965(+)
MHERLVTIARPWRRRLDLDHGLRPPEADDPLAFAVRLIEAVDPINKLRVPADRAVETQGSRLEEDLLARVDVVVSVDEVRPEVGLHDVALQHEVQPFVELPGGHQGPQQIALPGEPQHLLEPDLDRVRLAADHAEPRLRVTPHCPREHLRQQQLPGEALLLLAGGQCIVVAHVPSVEQERLRVLHVIRREEHAGERVGDDHGPGAPGLERLQRPPRPPLHAQGPGRLANEPQLGEAREVRQRPGQRRAGVPIPADLQRLPALAPRLLRVSGVHVSGAVQDLHHGVAAVGIP